MLRALGYLSSTNIPKCFEEFDAKYQLSYQICLQPKPRGFYSCIQELPNLNNLPRGRLLRPLENRERTDHLFTKVYPNVTRVTRTVVVRQPTIIQNIPRFYAWTSNKTPQRVVKYTGHYGTRPSKPVQELPTLPEDFCLLFYQEHWIVIQPYILFSDEEENNDSSSENTDNTDDTNDTDDES